MVVIDWFQDALEDDVALQPNGLMNNEAENVHIAVPLVYLIEIQDQFLKCSLFHQPCPLSSLDGNDLFLEDL
jgi:hypothetical protein